MPNTLIGSNRPRLEPFARHNDVGAGAATTFSGDAGTTPATEPHADLFRRADAESLNAGEGRRAGNVSSLSAAPGLLNGSVVLPHPETITQRSGKVAGGVADAGATTGRSSAPRAAHGNVDAATAEAVSVLQRSEGLVADGVVGCARRRRWTRPSAGSPTTFFGTHRRSPDLGAGARPDRGRQVR